MTRRAIVASLSLIPGFFRAQLVSAEPLGYPRFRRGISIYHLLGHLSRTAGGAVIWPPYATDLEAMSDIEMRALKEAGFDFVRIVVAPDVFFQAQDSAQVAFLEKKLSSTVGRFVSAHLNVVLDMHPSPDARSYAPIKMSEPGGDVLFAKYKETIVRMARVLRKFPSSRVALELFNEPPFAGNTGFALWQLLVVDLFQSVSAVAPDLCLIVPGAGGGTIDGLIALDPRPMLRKNVYFTFHFYEPYLFTHQGIGDFRDLHDIPWPSDKGSLALISTAVSKSIMENQAYAAAGRVTSAVALALARLTKYFSAGATSIDIDARLAHVADWATMYDVPRSSLLMGEFGVNRAIAGRLGAEASDASLWISTVCKAAERNGMAWAFWCYAGQTDMSLANEFPAKTFSARTIQALGLSVPLVLSREYR